MGVARTGEVSCIPAVLDASEPMRSNTSYFARIFLNGTAMPVPGSLPQSVIFGAEDGHSPSPSSAQRIQAHPADRPDEKRRNSCTIGRAFRSEERRVGKECRSLLRPE